MSVTVQVSEVIERPVEDVFRFYAMEHVQNHPRWDPYMELELITDGPIGVGSVIKRVNSRSGSPVEGTMEVVEFEKNQSMSMNIHDGPMQMLGRAIVEPEGDEGTKLTFDVEIPGMDKTTGTSVFSEGMQQSLRNIKQLIESET